MGSNDSGELGLDAQYSYVDKPTLVSLQNGFSINKVVSGWGCSYLLDNNGQWYACGSGHGPGLTYSKNIYSPIPISLPNNKPIVDIKLGFESFFLCDKDGQWHACGSNRNEELGLGIVGSYVLTPQPIQLPNNRRIIKIIASNNHTFFCDEDWQWHGCGYSNDGALGLGCFPSGRVFTPKPINLPNGNRIIDIKAGSSHTFFLDCHLNWYGCGSNEHGGPILKREISSQFRPVQISFSNLERKIEGYRDLSRNGVRPDC